MFKTNGLPVTPENSVSNIGFITVHGLSEGYIPPTHDKKV